MLLPAFGITATQIFWGVIVVAALILAFWALGRRDRMTTYRGTKGGRIKRTITEYEGKEDSI